MCSSSSKSTQRGQSFSRSDFVFSWGTTQLTCDQVQLWLRRYNDSSSNHKVACLTLPLSLDKKLEHQIAVNCERVSRVGLSHSWRAAQHVTWPTLQPLCASSPETAQSIRHVFFKDLRRPREGKDFPQNPNWALLLPPKTSTVTTTTHKCITTLQDLRYITSQLSVKITEGEKWIKM